MKTFAIFFLSLTASFAVKAQSAGDYRTVGTGVTTNWSVVASWETYNGTSWVAASAAPTSANGAITIQSPDYITIAAAITIDQVTVNAGARLRLGANIALTIANGTGTDLQVYGTFVDSSSTSITWNASSTWLIGSAGTLIRCRGTSAATGWQNNYQGGIATIPSTANWIIRKRDASNPIITTLGMYYPNFTIENYYTSAWTTATTSTFQGTTNYPTVKGNFDIGGSGTNTVDFLNQHTNATPTIVQGNVLVRTGNTLRNYGTGLEIQGNLTVSGTISYDASDSRLLRFTGTNAQTVSGAGTLGVYDMTVNKTSNTLTFLRAVTVDNALTLTSGIVYTTAANLLTINTNGTVTGASNSSFVSGPVRYVGNAAFTFPVGKGSDYQPLSYSATTPSGGTFWTETFNNSCVSGCSANGVNTGNGAWTVDNSNNPSTDNCGQSPQSNVWYVSCQENGNANGACGTGCGSNATLHIGSTSVGDQGASFDAGGYCDILGPGWGGGTNTNTLVVSPSISTVGQTNITLSFLYLHYGEAGSDYGWVDYSTDNGATWSTLVNPMPQVTCCGGPCNNTNQGQWATYTTSLPAAAENITGFKLRFGWINDDNSAGNDPSFAINDITLSTPSSPVDFTCEYFYANPQTTYGNTLVPSLDHISACEYWILTRNAGTASKSVTLTWDANSCGVSLLSDLRVARYDGTSTWQNEGNTGTTGNTSTGTITSTTVTSFSPFTLASVSSQNPLPVELLNFGASFNGSTVDLDWSTATELNNDYFTIERTSDGERFTEITRVNGAGNSSIRLDYHTIDPYPLTGTSFYRLKQTDFDGKFTYSHLAAVNIKQLSGLNILSFFQSAENIEAVISCSCLQPLTAELYDMTGKIVLIPAITASGHFQSLSFKTSTLARGIYLLKVSDGTAVVTRKFRL